MRHSETNRNPRAIAGLWRAVQTWGEMVKFSHSVFALPFALTATFLAACHLPGRLPKPGQIGLIIVCMVAARSFAMTFNRVIDARIDGRNPRTSNRPLPAGRLRAAQAWSFLLVSVGVFGVGCLGFDLHYGNPWPLYLALPTLVALAGYSYCKRITTLSHFFLGAVISFSPFAAWIAVDPRSLGWSAAFLSGAVCFWIAGFDLIYACQDVEADRREGLFSIPARWGIARALLLSRVCHMATIGYLLLLGLQAELGWVYWSGVGLTAGLLVVEQSMVKPHDLSRVNLAFFTINGVVSLVLAATAICDIVIRR